MRPISVVSILSRLTERLVISTFYTPTLTTFPALQNQFAYRPTSSTTAALIALFDTVTSLLRTNPFVIVLSFDYSKAFDTLAHTSVATALSSVDLPDNIYNWSLDFLTARSHQTIFHGQQSSSAQISAGVIQGSVMGPTLFNLASSTLTPLSPANSFFKYADDGYLVVPANNSDSIPDELDHHQKWATAQNLKLNMAKTSEIVFYPKRSTSPPPPLNPGITRVNQIKILGILVDDKLCFQFHINETIKNCAQALFALMTLRHQGLTEESLQLTFSSKVLSKLTYASPAWWGFISEEAKCQLEAFIRKACRFNYYSPSKPSFHQLVATLESNLFHSITTNPHHCLHPLLPPLKTSHYNLRNRGHNYSLPTKDDRNFMNRLLYRLM
jgi:hypothetical protein